MQPIALSDYIAVGEPPTPEEFDILAKCGFRSVLHNQPDGELERLLDSSAAEAEAKRAGLQFRYVPVDSRTPPETTIRAFATALNELPAPIYAYCYSGARSAAGWALSLAGQQDADSLIEACGKAGYDITSLKPWLVALHQSKAAPAAAPSPAPIVTGGGTDAAGGVQLVGHPHNEGAGRTAALVTAPLLPRAGSPGGFAI